MIESLKRKATTCHFTQQQRWKNIQPTEGDKKFYNIVARFEISKEEREKKILCYFPIFDLEKKKKKKGSGGAKNWSKK